MAKIALTVQTYNETTQTTFVAHRWARVTGNAAGNDESDIYWPVKVGEDSSEATEDTNDDYKLIRVTAFLK